MTASPRLVALDAVRGAAVLGILLLNIVDFAMPGYAYVDPNFYGGADGANWWAWALNFAFADGKFRGLFTVLFGASAALIAERSASPARVHYARMATLFAIGMVHAYLVWSGDILVSYAICGALLYVALRWRTASLLAIAAILMIGQLAGGAATYAGARHFEARATAPGAPAATRRTYAAYRAGLDDLRAAIPADLAASRGGWRSVLPHRVAEAWEAQTHVLPATIAETIALMLLGIALYRSGFLDGRWPRRRYLLLLVAGYGLALPLYLPLIRWIDATRFDPVTLALAQPLHLVVLRPVVMLAHAALVILLLGRSPRLAAVGRMALSNYLACSLVGTFLFCGYGLGLYGHLQRWQLYPIVLAVWIAMLLWSKPWLDRFAYGPAEWLWRSMARGRWQRLTRGPPAP